MKSEQIILEERHRHMIDCPPDNFFSTEYDEWLDRMNKQTRELMLDMDIDLEFEYFRSQDRIERGLLL